MRGGDIVVCQSMDRLARNMEELRTLVSELTQRGVRIEFVREQLTFTAESQPLLHMLHNFAEFERSLLQERRREGIAVAKAQGKYKGHTAKLSPEQAHQLRQRANAGESKTALAKEFGISRETLYTYLRMKPL